MSKKAPPVLRLNNFKKKEDLITSFYIKTFREHKKEHPFVMDAHAHDFYMVTLFTSGSGTHTIDLTTYPVGKGSIFFMSPGEMHAWKLSDDTEGYVLFFSASFYRMDAGPAQLQRFPFFRAAGKLSSGLLDPGRENEIENFIGIMEAESRTESAFRANILRSMLDTLLYKLSSFLGTRPVSPVKASLMPQLEMLVEEHYKEHRPASFYAELLHISTQQLNAHAKSYLNKTVADLLRERLIAEAKRLLVYSGLSVSEIAYALSFSDNSYFNRFFKRSEKLTPEQFRKRFI
jgi:AraC-like DNA-binding protein